MPNYMELQISCETHDSVMATLDRLKPQLPIDVRRRFTFMQLRYWQLHGEDGLFERVNNRTVGEILAVFESHEKSAPIASGEIDGLRYQLYDAPDAASSPKASLDKNDVGDD